MAHHANPVALGQRLDDVGIDLHAADVLDLGAGQRLAIRDDGQRFQQRARITRRTLRPEPRHILRNFTPHLHPKPLRGFLQFHTATGERFGNLAQHHAQLVVVRPVLRIEQLRNLRQ